MAFDPYSSIQDFETEDWHDDKGGSHLLEEGKHDRGLIVAMPPLGRRKSNADSATLKPNKSIASEPGTSVTAPLSEANESFSFEINLPPGVDVSPLSCKESVIAMMLARSVDRALDASPPVYEIHDSSRSSRTRSRSRSRPTSHNHSKGESDRRRSRSRHVSDTPGPSGDRKSHRNSDRQTASISNSHVDRKDATDLQDRDQRRTVSREKAPKGESRTRSISRHDGRRASSQKPTVRSREKSHDRSSESQDRHHRRSRSSSTSRQSREGRSHRSQSKVRVHVMDEISEDRSRRSPSRSRNRSQSRAPQRSRSRAPSQGPGSGGSTRTRSKSRARENTSTQLRTDYKKAQEDRHHSPRSTSRKLTVVEEDLEDSQDPENLGLAQPSFLKMLLGDPIGEESENHLKTNVSSASHSERPPSRSKATPQEGEIGKQNQQGGRSHPSTSKNLGELSPPKVPAADVPPKQARSSKWAGLRAGVSLVSEARKDGSHSGSRRIRHRGLNDFGGSGTPGESRSPRDLDGCVSVQPKLQTVVMRQSLSPVLGAPHPSNQQAQMESNNVLPLNSVILAEDSDTRNPPKSPASATRSSFVATERMVSSDPSTSPGVESAASKLETMKRLIDDTKLKAKASRRRRAALKKEKNPDTIESCGAVGAPIVQHGESDIKLVPPKLATVILKTSKAESKPSEPGTKEKVSKWDRLKMTSELIQEKRRKKDESRTRQRTLEEMGSLPNSEKAETSTTSAELHIEESGSASLETNPSKVGNSGVQFSVDAAPLQRSDLTKQVDSNGYDRANSKWTGLKRASQFINNTKNRVGSSAGSTRRRMEERTSSNCQAEKSPEPRKPSSSKWKDLAARIGTPDARSRTIQEAAAVDVEYAGRESTLKASATWNTVGISGVALDRTPEVNVRKRVSKWASLRSARDFIASTGRHGEQRQRLIDDDS